MGLNENKSHKMTYDLFQCTFPWQLSIKCSIIYCSNSYRTTFEFWIE